MLAVIYWDVNPLIFPGLDFLRWYGICWAMGVILGYLLFQRMMLKERSLNLPEIDKLALYVMIGAIVGARLGHILFYEPIYYLNHPEELLPVQFSPFRITGLRGLASHGGIAGGLIALFFYTRRYKKNFLFLLDRLTIPGALLAGFIRLGNLMNSEIVGIATNRSWGFVFTRIDQLPRHPAQLYESLWYFLTLLLLWYFWKNQSLRNRRGFLFGLGMTSIFLLRFLVEFIKEDQVAFEAQMLLKMGQLLSIPLLLTGLGIMIWALRRPKLA